MTQQLVLNAVTEKEFQEQVVTLARLQGWRHYHTFDSRRSPFGFPDLVLVRGGRIIFAEIKAERGKLTPQQIEWLNDLEANGHVDVFCWKPSDWPEVEKVLAR